MTRYILGAIALYLGYVRPMHLQQALSAVTWAILIRVLVDPVVTMRER